MKHSYTKVRLVLFVGLALCAIAGIAIGADSNREYFNDTDEIRTFACSKSDYEQRKATFSGGAFSEFNKDARKALDLALLNLQMYAYQASEVVKDFEKEAPAICFEVGQLYRTARSEGFYSSKFFRSENRFVYDTIHKMTCQLEQLIGYCGDFGRDNPDGSNWQSGNMPHFHIRIAAGNRAALSKELDALLGNIKDLRDKLYSI